MQPDANLSALERALAELRPTAGGLDPDAMLFAAGRASAKRNLAWPAATTAFAALSVCLGVALVAERTQREAVEARWRVPLPAAVEPSPEPTAGTFAFRRDFDPNATYAQTLKPGSSHAPPDSIPRGWPVRTIEP